MRAYVCACLLAVILFGCYPPAQTPRAIHEFEQNIDGRVETLANQVVRLLSQRRSHRVAIKGFYDLDGESDTLEKYLDMEITDRLFRTGLFKIVQREELERFDEAKLAEFVEEEVPEAIKELDEEEVKRLARIFNIDSILVGTTVELNNAVKVSVKLISTRTGAIFGTASVLLKKDAVVKGLLRGGFGTVSGMISLQDGRGYGNFIQLTDNQYYELIPGEFIVYIKQIRRHMDLYMDDLSPKVELYLNEDFKVLGLDELITITYKEDKYVLTLRRVMEGAAVFTFAKLNKPRGVTKE